MNQAIWQTVCNLGAAVAERGDPAWPPLWSGICPALRAWLACPSIRQALCLSQHDKDPEDGDDKGDDELLVRIWECLQQNHYHKLRAFFALVLDRPAEARAPAFRQWLYRVLEDTAIERLRAQPSKDMAAALASLRSRGAAQASAKWRAPTARQSFDTHGGEMLEFLDDAVPRYQRDAVTLANVGMGASEIAAHLGLPSPAAAAQAVERGRERLMYRRALELWSQGHSDEDLAAALALGDVAQAERLIRAATEFLRHHFSGAEADFCDCDTAEVLASEIAAGQRPAEALAALERHLSQCQRCSELQALRSQFALSCPLPPDRETGIEALAIPAAAAEERGSESREPDQEAKQHDFDRADSLPFDHPDPEPRPARELTAGAFTAPERFELRQRLGSGGMGVVYEAYDRQRDAVVALKTLRNLDARTLYRLKNEFRIRQDILHPNLVTLGELFEHQGQWFFTMELVRGLSFLRYVRLPGPDPGDTGENDPPAAECDTEETRTSERRTAIVDSSIPTAVLDAAMKAKAPGTDPLPAAPRPPRYDSERLRSAMTQLCLALGALHAGGKVHRDVKPGNILVTESGRLVLLDFGLVTDAIGSDSTHNRVVGTPAYMAPEQASGKPVGPEADLYSVGVILYEALTGQKPFAGTISQILASKRRLTPTRPRDLVPAVPAELDSLCMALLNPKAPERPGIAEILACLGTRARAAAVGPAPRQHERVLIGRDRELAWLSEAFRQSRDSGTVIALIHGHAGAGKSALMDRFAADIRGSAHAAVVLHGRCYEHERVPFNAFDKVIDGLARYVARLLPRDAAALMPRRAGLLGQLFPVMRRIAHIAESSASPADEPVPDDMRSQALGALRDLFARLSDRLAVVIAIEDMHWADVDSIELLCALVQPPDAPRLLVIATLCDPGGAMAGALAERLGSAARRLSLLPLSMDDSAALLRTSLVHCPPAPVDEQSIRALAAEAGGYPRFLALVAGAWNGGDLKLADVLSAQIVALSLPAQRVLELVCVAPWPVPAEILRRAADISAHELSDVLNALRASWLTRTASAPGQIEPYHALVRAHVQATLSLAAVRECHGRLAQALEAALAGELATDTADTIDVCERLSVHWTHAGDSVRASRFAVDGAARAHASGKTTRAALLYRQALTGAPASQRYELLLALGDAHAAAGASDDAAGSYRQALAEATSASERLRVAECLAAAGQAAESMELIRGELGAVGLGLPPTPARGALLAVFAQLRMRGAPALGRRRSMASAGASAAERARLATCLSAGAALSSVAPALATACYARSLCLAAAAGEPGELARALGLYSMSRALLGKLDYGVHASLRYAGELAAVLGRDDVSGLVASGRAVVALLSGNWRDAASSGQEALALLANCGWELVHARRAAQLGRLFAHHYTGEQGEPYASELPTGLWCLSALSLGSLGGHVHAATDGTGAYAAQEPLTLPAVGKLLGRVYAHLDAGRGRDAWREIRESCPRVFSSELGAFTLARSELLYAHGRSALAAAALGEDGLLPVSERNARALSKEPLPWARPMAELLYAGTALVRHDPAQAITHLRRAAERFHRGGMRLYADLAEWRADELTGKEQGRSRQLIGQMRDRGIAEPARLRAVLML